MNEDDTRPEWQRALWERETAAWTRLHWCGADYTAVHSAMVHRYRCDDLTDDVVLRAGSGFYRAYVEDLEKSVDGVEALMALRTEQKFRAMFAMFAMFGMSRVVA